MALLFRNVLHLIETFILGGLRTLDNMKNHIGFVNGIVTESTRQLSCIAFIERHLFYSRTKIHRYIGVL